MLVLAIGTFVATAAAAAFAWVQAIVAVRAEKGAKRSLDLANAQVEAAQRQAKSAEEASVAAGRQASAAESFAGAAGRQATAAEAIVDRTDRYRADDRRADAVMELTRMIYREVEFASSHDLWGPRAFLRFANGDRLIRAYSLLDQEDHDVARWVANRRDIVMDEVDQAMGEVSSGRVGRHQSAAARVAAETSQELLKWLRGERTRASFTAEL
jgi:hypothetical protein